MHGANHQSDSMKVKVFFPGLLQARRKILGSVEAPVCHVVVVVVVVAGRFVHRSFPTWWNVQSKKGMVALVVARTPVLGPVRLNGPYRKILIRRGGGALGSEWPVDEPCARFSLVGGDFDEGDFERGSLAKGKEGS